MAGRLWISLRRLGWFVQAFIVPPRQQRTNKRTVDYQRRFKTQAAAKRERVMELGIERYRWLALDVHGTCEVAKRNGGKIFEYANPPPDGHPGEGRCRSPDWCRCQAISIVPGFED